MEDDAPVIYGLEFQVILLHLYLWSCVTAVLVILQRNRYSLLRYLQARALTAQTAETDAVRFLVGTQSLKFDNQVRATLSSHLVRC